MLQAPFAFLINRGPASIDLDQGAAEHSQRNAARGLFLVVESVALLGQAVLGIRRFVAGAEDAVEEIEVLELEGLQLRVGCAHETPKLVVQGGGSNTSLPVNFLERNIC